MKRLPHGVSALTILALVFASGCSETTRRPVSGNITFQGKPLPGGTITFLRTGNPPGPAGGALVRDGSFTMPGEQGLEPGTYRVEIRSPKSNPRALASPFNADRIPRQYNSRSQLTAEVKARSDNRFDFAIP